MRTEPLRANLTTSNGRPALAEPGNWLGDWFTQQWGAHWSQLSPSEQAKVQQSWGQGSLEAVQNLSQETHSEIFWTDLVALAQGAEKGHKLPLARSLYGAIVERHPHSPQAHLAQTRLNLIEGGGELGERLAWSTSRLMEQVTDPGLLLGMGVGASGFFLSRGALLRLLGGNTLGRRTLATLGGMATEVPAMVLTTRGLHHFISPRGGNGQMSLLAEMRHLGLSLVALRGAGHLTHSLVGGMATSSLAARALPQAAMFNGILAMRGLEIALGMSPTQSPQAFLVDALALQIQFNAMNRLVPHVGRPASSLEARSRPRPQRPWTPALAFAAAGPAPLSIRAKPLGTGSNLVLSVGQASSSRPPAPIPEPGPVNLRRPARSGVQVKADRAKQEPLLETFSTLEHELNLFLINEGIHSLRWHHHSLLSLTRTRDALVRYGETQSQTGSLPHLPELVREVEHSIQLLRDFDPATASGNPARAQSNHLLDFFNNQYAVPNKMVNFLNGQAPLHEVLASARRSRRALQDFIESHQLPQGPVFPENLNIDLIQQVDQFSATMFRAYMFQSRQPWLPSTLETVRGYQNYLGQIAQRFSHGGKPQIYLEETRRAQQEIQNTEQGLSALQDTARPGLEGPALDSALTHLFKSPKAFAEFLETGRLSHLRASRDHLAQANQALKNQAE